MDEQLKEIVDGINSKALNDFKSKADKLGALAFKARDEWGLAEDCIWEAFEIAFKQHRDKIKDEVNSKAETLERTRSETEHEQSGNKTIT